MRRLIVLLVSVASTAGMCDQKLSDPMPPSLADQQVPSIEASVVQVPLTVSLDFIRNQLEAAVPLSLGVAPYNEQINGGADNCKAGGVSFGWGVDRGAVAVSATGNSIGMSFGVDYFVQARARPDLLLGCGPLAGASCGVGEPKRAASISVAVPFFVTPNWALSAGRGNVNVAPQNRCLVTIFNKDVTDKVVEAFQQQLQRQTDSLNARLAQTNLRSRLESAWQSLLQPISIAPQTWLMVNPAALSLSTLVGQANAVSISAALTANPSVSLGVQPQPLERALPDATPAVAGNGFHLAVPLIAQTSELTNQLRRALKLDEGGIRYPPTGGSFIQPDAADLWAYGRQMVVRIHFQGSAKGTLYLVGTPIWDGATNAISAPDLDYTLESRNVVLKLANWAEGDRFRDDLKNRLRVNLAAEITAARALVQQSLNRNVGLVRLSGNVNALRVAGLYVHPGDSTVRIIVVTDGTLNAEIQ